MQFDPFETFLLTTKEQHSNMTGDQQKNLGNTIQASSQEDRKALRETLLLSNIHFLIGQSSNATSQPADMEDAFQEMVSLLINPPSDYDPSKGKYTTYCYATVMRVRMQYANRIHNTDIDNISLDALPVDNIDPTEKMDQEEEAKKMRIAMQRMKKSNEHKNWHRTIMEYYGLGDDDPKTTGEIAEQRGVSKTAISAQLRKGIAES